jgi:hypothetical protein
VATIGWHNHAVTGIGNAAVVALTGTILTDMKGSAKPDALHIYKVKSYSGDRWLSKAEMDDFMREVMKPLAPEPMKTICGMIPWMFWTLVITVAFSLFAPILIKILHK